MRKFQWNEDEIQSVLKQMPMVNDRRSKEEIYRQMKRREKQEGRKTRIVPAFVSVAAACLLIIIGASIYSSSLAPVKKSKENRMEMAKSMDIAKSTPQQKQSLMMKAENESAVSSRIVQKGKVIVFGLPDKSLQVVIPVSIAVSKQEGSREQQIETAKTQLPEQWGLDTHWFDHIHISPSSTHPSGWIVRIGRAHPVFSGGAASEAMLLASVEETVRSLGGTSIQFFTGGRKGVKLSHIGHLEALKVSRKKRAYYFYQLDDAHPPFLVPSKETFATIEAAFKSMQNVKSDILRPSISKRVRIAAVQKHDGQLAVKFAANSAFDGSSDSQWMLEAILLAAKEFGFRSVMFTGGNVKQIGPYSFGKTIPVPIAPNPMPVN
ncbi:hypothetical protein [Anoxybacteroides tepidamans]|uniref:hypothetical protein n=1 Tax=Anoxybacteroides tepidamans TaxID=265948 RepID=UPI000488944B|nr:hypothetical protein [Anoxybacillus tepidamans]